MRRLTKEEFVTRSIQLHGENMYDYSKVVYVNNKKRVLLKCNSCGETFELEPFRHLQGYGCQCKLSETRWNRELFIQRATKLHNCKYTYEQVTEDAWKGMDNYVYITCPIHGTFKQTPESHLSGRGCRRCYEESKKSIICGVGINDYHGRVRENGKLLDSYSHWVGMIKRCYNESELKGHLSYSDCSVCKDWLYFSNFKKWFDDKENGYREGYHLDKDILIPNNRVYSPQTCCFVPHEINVMLRNSISGKTLPIGVYKNHKKFSASYNNKVLGLFDTPEEALSAYASRKEAEVKARSQEYYDKGLITRKVYDALQRYNVKQYKK